jgi:Uma2 family endonuclease
MSTTTRLTTAEELLAMPRGVVRRELVAGEVKVMSLLGAEESVVAMHVLVSLGTYETMRRLGRVLAGGAGFLLARSPDTVLAPDVAFVRRERIATGVPKTFFPGAPDLAVEVVSPSESSREVDAKAQSWLAHGAREVWVVDPADRSVTIHRAAAERRRFSGNEILESPELLPGFCCPLADIFDLA